MTARPFLMAVRCYSIGPTCELNFADWTDRAKKQPFSELKIA